MIKSFLLNNKELGYACMAVLVFLITFCFGLLVKHFTKKITDETKRKSANSILYFIAVALGFLVEHVYSLITELPFQLNYGLVIGACSVGTNEGIKILKYYFLLVVEKVATGKKITAEELIAPLPIAENITEPIGVVDNKADGKKVVTDDVKVAQSELDKLLK